MSSPRCRLNEALYAMRPFFAAAPLFALLGVTAEASASGFSTAYFGGAHGNVTESNPTALYYNPGAIASNSSDHLFLEGTFALRQLSWNHPASPDAAPDPPEAPGANVGRAELLNPLIAPTLAGTLHFGDLALGAGVFVPFGGQVAWDKNDRFANNAAYPFTIDGVQRWHSIEADVKHIYATLGAAYRYGMLSVGVSANLVRSELYHTQAKNATGGGDVDTTHEGRAELDVSGFQGSFGLGLLVEAIEEQLWFGASYQAQPGLGPMRLRGTLTIDYSGSSAPFQVTLDQALPDVVRAGVRYRPQPDLELRLFGDFTRWSVMQTQCIAHEHYACQVDATGADSGDGGVLLNIRRNWQDSWGVQAGTSYWLSAPLELFLGAGFEEAAVPDSTLDPELADAANVSALIGARIGLGKTWFVGATLKHLFMPDRNNVGKSKLAQAELPTKRADGGGVYEQSVSILNASVEKLF
jgi:long-chain fatty acid transport protein